MKISVAICTWNRSGLLRRTLQSIAEMEMGDPIEWELIVVDNNSSDDTADVIGSFAQQLPIRYVHEPQQGLSLSRNRAIDTATGDYILWTDDDVLVSKQWLNAYRSAFAAAPDIAFFGGCIEPWFEPPGCPDWISETWAKCNPAFSPRMLGDAEVELTAERLPYGANFAVRTDVQQAHRYDPRWGRVGSGMMGGEEIAVLREIVRCGGRGRWVPGAPLRHIVPARRASEKFVRDYFVGQGMENVAAGRTVTGRMANGFDAIYSMLLYRIKRRFVEPDEWVSHMIRASISWGEFRAPRS
ncbi:GalNAc(5)-diNAcBac-PP-undecaprenol beta-1,3-glucosyltransferase [Rosistilla ulvae]|uniref:GalNAc(5)-diNAcBac-PP-undecaprenol beta-1,3-glucosyltransferase n=1 Tax=Rosistilla ulvae TaxID=1930277 RepID=A0A517LTS4_9BACT|nr:glycosyltransferase [Rosistilla ulvae]QDS85999.1 GalNAc(5)-diNAcBac-PP-undecaprenol beta-1,3-glucosyltransferase [Rosistilla ulvae]